MLAAQLRGAVRGAGGTWQLVRAEAGRAPLCLRAVWMQGTVLEVERGGPRGGSARLQDGSGPFTVLGVEEVPKGRPCLSPGTGGRARYTAPAGPLSLVLWAVTCRCSGLVWTGVQLLALSESRRLAGSGCVSSTCLGRAELAQLHRHTFTYTSLPTRGILKKLCCYGSHRRSTMCCCRAVCLWLSVQRLTRPSPTSSCKDRACFQFFTVTANV